MLKTPEGNKMDVQEFIDKEEKRKSDYKKLHEEYLFNDINKLVVTAMSSGKTQVELPSNIYAQLSVLELFPTLERYGYTVIIKKTVSKILWVYPIYHEKYILYWLD